MAAPQHADTGRLSPGLRLAFEHYSHWFLRRHFNSLRLDSSGHTPLPEATCPRVVFLNHASWWDPLVCLQLRRRFLPQYTAHAPIDAEALERYAFFRRLGFFGVRPNSRPDAARFLRVALAILQTPRASLWLTPQGRFADVRERPLRFEAGLGHLAARAARRSRHPMLPAPTCIQFVPLAIEYTHWHERRPEILARFGSPIELSTYHAQDLKAEDWTARLESALATTMDQLAEHARERRPERFSNVLDGRPGVGLAYDTWRRLAALFGGHPFEPRHGRL